MSDADTMFSLFLELGDFSPSEGEGFADEAVQTIRELDGVIETLAGEGVSVRGFYDCTGFESFAGVLIWLRAATADDLQWGMRQLRRTAMMRDLREIDVAITIDLTEVDEVSGGWLSMVHASDAAEVAASGAAGVAEGGAVVVDDGEPGPDAVASASLHGRLGVGPERYLVVAESDDVSMLIGDLGELFDAPLELLDGSQTVGRQVTTAELFEILR